MKTPASSIKTTLDSLSDEEWREIITRMGYFYMSRYGWDRRLEMEDVIQATILAAYSRTMPEGIDLVTFLCWTVMRSHTSHILERMNRCRIDPIEECSELEVLKKKDVHKHYQVCVELRDLVGDDDPLLRILVEYRVRDPDAKLCDMLSSLTPPIPKHEVENAYRRLKTLIIKLKRKSDNG